MPRESTKRLRGQMQVNPQETYDPTVPRFKVSARAVDPYVAHGRSQDAMALMHFADSFSRMQGLARGLATDKAEEQEKAGEAAAQRDEEPKWGSAAFMEGYDNHQGQAAVSSYIAKTAELSSQSHNMTPDEFMGRLEAIDKEFMNGRSDAFLRGFVPKAMNIRIQHEEAYAEKAREFVKSDYLSGVKSRAYADTVLVLNDKTVAPEQRAEVIRGVLDSYQVEAKDKYAIADRREISLEFTKTMIEEAVRGANPGLLEFTAVKDKSGIALIDDPELAPLIYDGIRAAESAQAANESAASKARAAAQKAAQENAEKGLVDAWIKSTTQAGGATSMVATEFHTYLQGVRNEIGVDFYERYRKLGVDLFTGAGFAAKGRTNPKVFGYMWDMASNDMLSDQDLDRHAEHIDPDNYIELIKHRASMRKYFSGQEGSSFKTTWDSYVADARAIAAPSNGLGAFLDPNIGPVRAQAVRHQMGTLLDDFRKENGEQAYPSRMVMDQWVQTVSEAVMKRYRDPIDTSGAGTTTVTPTTSNPGAKRDGTTTTTPGTVNTSKQDRLNRLKQARGQ